MQRLKKMTLAIFLSLLLTIICNSFTTPVYAAKRFQNSKFAMLIIDGSTGTVLYQENAGKYRYPASLTKVMTMYLVFDALESGKLGLGTMVRVSKHAAAQSPSKLYLKAGDKISIKDAIMAVAIKSANDAAVVLAEAVAGSEYEFALQMTRKARDLGMKHTVFRNASGLPDSNQKTTAYDLARMAMAIYRDHQKYYYLFAKSSYTYRGKTLYTHNRVTKRYRGADGLKTGFINASGFNLLTSAQRGNRRIVGVVMGGRTAAGRDQYMIEMLDKGFRKLARGGDRGAELFVGNIPVPKYKPDVFASVISDEAEPVGQGDVSDGSEDVALQGLFELDETPEPKRKPRAKVKNTMSYVPAPVRKPKG